MTGSLKRITPGEVVEAYRVTGIRPARHCWLEMEATVDGSKECGCGFSAVMIAENGEAARAFFRLPTVLVTTARVIRHFGVDSDYATGFVEGFDGFRDYAIGEAPDAMRIGREDGRAAASTVFGSPDPPEGT